MLIRGQIYYENKISKHKDFNVINYLHFTWLLHILRQANGKLDRDDVNKVDLNDKSFGP